MARPLRVVVSGAWYEYIHLNSVRVKRFGTSSTSSDREGPGLEHIAEMVKEHTNSSGIRTGRTPDISRSRNGCIRMGSWAGFRGGR